MIELRPTEDLYAQITDCRTAALSGSFHGLTREQTDELFRDYHAFADGLLSASCILDWTAGDRVLKDLGAYLRGSGPYPALYVQGKVPGTLVRTRTAMRRFFRDAVYDPALMQDIAPPGASVDYVHKRIRYLDRYEDDPERFREALEYFFLFDFPYLQQYAIPDVCGFVSAEPMAGDAADCRGRLSLSVSFACLKDGPDEIAERFREFAERLSAKYAGVSLAVGPETRGGLLDFPDYLFYFMEHDEPADHAAMLREQELWAAARYLYAEKVGWVNILSPAAAKLVGTGPRFAVEDPDVMTEPLGHGGLEIRSAKPFGETKMKDYVLLKAAMYGALYPGKSSVTIRPEPDLRFTGLRERWECVPLLTQELRVAGSTIFFRHLGTLDRELVADLFRIP